MRAGTSAVVILPTPGTPITDASLLDALAIVADLWHARLNDRIPFGRMPRERLSALAQAQQALGQLQSRSSRGDRDRFSQEMLVEVQALNRFAAGQGDLSDQAIDVAQRIADQAATGRPIVGPGPYPVAPPGGASYPPVTGGPEGPPPLGGPEGPPPLAGPEGPPPLGGPEGPPPPPLMPPSNGPSPYELPPGYAEYAPSSQGGAAATGCQTLRQSASASASVTDMLRAAECWTRQPTWPGWALQVHEALDWAALYARFDRDCEGLSTVIDKIRDLGSSVAIAGLTSEMTSLARRTEMDRRWLASQDMCR